MHRKSFGMSIFMKKSRIEVEFYFYHKIMILKADKYILYSGPKDHSPFLSILMNQNIFLEGKSHLRLANIEYGCDNMCVVNIVP